LRLKFQRAIQGVFAVNVIKFERGSDLELLLHAALKNKDGSSDEAVLALLDEDYDRAGEKDSKLNLPIHVAARMNASVAVMEALLSAFPPGVAERNKMGYIPLHLVGLYKLYSVYLCFKAPGFNH
jgi:ankyrin repeat protein